ncbi:conserved Plasmodium protein, unknown function [Plasmodium gallinaceum]|uniref:WD repeat-containing protein n=1 Tax=Plasmodium gallinaceum TaxID=5849 RepID=A0A1J1GR91_PLAGA|nr:conserved Plasmodium protein, unknown function [Plasmodium gallinaceum]CRG94788.1 conserved Plasmodium protein, unknown function [Plasmodium gallinaceum]
MKNTKYNQSNLNIHGRSKYELRCKKNEMNKNINEEESEDVSNVLSDSSLSCCSMYMIREENNRGKNEETTKKVHLKNKYKNKNTSLGLDNKVNNVFSKQSYIYEHYKKKDILLSLWWKNIIDLYSDILITNLCSNVSNIEILNMNNNKNDYQYLNEGIILFHNTKKSNNYKMSILRVITKEEINKKNENDFFYSSAVKNNVIDESFKKYYCKKYKYIPIIKRYNCMNIPYYTTNSTISYCNKEMNNYETNFIHDGNVIIANKSIEGKIYLYNIKKTIDRINNIEDIEGDDEEREEENEDNSKNEDKEENEYEGNRKSGDINKNCLRNNDLYCEKDIKSKKAKYSESYKKKLEQRKIYDGELLLELLGHNKTGKGLFLKNNYMLSNGDDKKVFIYDINSSTIKSNDNKYGNDHINVSKINPLISIKTNEIYSNVRWLYDSLIIGSTYSGYFSLFDIRMKNELYNFNNLNNNNSRHNVNMYSMHKKITNYEISDIDKYNNEDNNLICLSSLNNIFIFDLRFINNNLPYKILHDNSYNNFSINDSYFEPYQTELQNGEYNSNTNVNYFYDHSYNNFYNEDFFNSDTFIHSLFWCNIEAFNYIGSLNNKGIINIYDVNKSKHHCVFTYGCKYIKLFKFNPFKINNFISVDKNNILILFTLPDQIYKSDLDLYLKDNFKEE